MAELKDYPFINQLSSPTLDGRPDENKWFNCVLAVLLSAMLYYRPDLRGKITPDSMKDAVLGEGYANKGTDAAWFVNFVTKYGLRLYKIENMPGKLIEEAHRLIQSGKPAIFTEVDPYVNTSLPQYAGWTHVGSWYKESPGRLVMMDPFGGKLVDESDAYWTQKIVGNELWTVEPLAAQEEDVTIDLNMPEVARYFTLFDTAGKQWKCRQTGKVVQYAMLNYYITNGAKPFCGLSSLGLPTSNEIPLPGVAGAVKQYFERGVLCYDPQHRIDNPPGAGNVYPLHLYNDGPGTDPAVPELEAEVQKLKAQLAQPGASQAQVDALKQQVAEAQSKLEKIKAMVA